MIYFLRKNGYYYRHHSCGYTNSAFEAEVYDEKYAQDHAEVHEDVIAVPVNEILSTEDIDCVLERIEAIQTFLEPLKYEVGGGGITDNGDGTIDIAAGSILYPGGR